MREKRRHRAPDIKVTRPIDSRDIISEVLKDLPTWTAPSAPDDFDWSQVHVVGIMREPHPPLSERMIEILRKLFEDVPGTSRADVAEEPPG
jgi:hypothetical protein